MSTGLVDTTRTWVTRPAREADAEAIASLWERRFEPHDDIPTDAARPWLPGSDHYDLNHSWVAESGSGDVVGAGLASIAGEDYLQESMHLSDAERESFTSGWDGYFYLLVVDKSWTGRGIGTALFRTRLAWFQDRDVNAAFGLSWQRRGAPTSTPIFERFGFRALAEKPDLYWEDERTCPDCGARCACPSVVFGRMVR